MWPSNVVPRYACVPWHGYTTDCACGMFSHQSFIHVSPSVLQVSSGVSMSVFKPTFPAVMPNPQNVLEGMIVSKSTIGAAAPTFLEVRESGIVQNLLSHWLLYGNHNYLRYGQEFRML